MPAITKSHEKMIVKEIEEKIINRTSANLTSATIKITIDPSKNCIKIPYIESTHSSNTIIKNKNSSIIPSDDDGSGYFQIRWPNPDILKYYYSSEDFEQIHNGDLVDCQTLIKGTDYSIGFETEGAYVFETKFIDLLINDYGIFKENVKSSVGEDFDIGFIYSNGTKITSSEKNISTNVYIKEIPIKYVNRKADINSGFMEIITWG